MSQNLFSSNRESLIPAADQLGPNANNYMGSL